MTERVPEVQDSGTVSERCSCWSHEGRRIGWTDDDPCPLHPDDSVPEQEVWEDLDA